MEDIPEDASLCDNNPWKTLRHFKNTFNYYSYFIDITSSRKSMGHSIIFQDVFQHLPQKTKENLSNPRIAQKALHNVEDIGRHSRRCWFTNNKSKGSKDHTRGGSGSAGSGLGATGPWLRYPLFLIEMVAPPLGVRQKFRYRHVFSIRTPTVLTTISARNPCVLARRCSTSSF